MTQWSCTLNPVSPRPHYLPAALIGGFGIPEAGPRARNRRYAQVCVRRWAGADRMLGPMRADQVAIQNQIYDVDEPSNDLAADFAEDIWKLYEGQLPDAIRALEVGDCTREHWGTLLLHIQAQSIRHPDFDAVASVYLTNAGVAQPSRDHVQRERLRTFVETRGTNMAKARFAILRRGKGAQRFIVNDKGYTTVRDSSRDAFGVLFPLSCEVAVFMAVGAARGGDDYEAVPVKERALNPRGLAAMNGATWEHPGIKCIIGHPDDAYWMKELVATGTVQELPRLGRYRGNREPGLFDWAFAPGEGPLPGTVPVPGT